MKIIPSFYNQNRVQIRRVGNYALTLEGFVDEPSCDFRQYAKVWICRVDGASFTGCFQANLS